MNSYTITIAPNDDSGNSTTIVVDTSGDQVSITDVHLHAGGGLTGGQLPTVDFGLLLRAVTTPTTPRPVEAAPLESPVRAESTAPPALTADERPDAAETPRTGRAARTGRRRTEAVPEPAAPPPARRGRGARVSAAKTAAAAAKATAAPARKPSKATKTAPGKPERAYRRMPEDFATVYEQIGSPAAIAEHYGVPRHTANNWIRRIRATTPPTAE